MTQIQSSKPTPRPTSPRNGVDVTRLFATLDVVKGQPDVAKFQFRASNEWVSGTHSQSTIAGFYGALQEDTSRGPGFKLDGDHPHILCGANQGPTPVEFLLHALASCITAGLVNVAAARGIELTRVHSTVEGDIDLLGIFGMAETVRNGYQGIRASFHVEGDASEEVLADLVARSQARSAVYDVLTHGVPVSIEVEAHRSSPPAEVANAPLAATA